jgi:hypothetical protein
MTVVKQVAHSGAAGDVDRLAHEGTDERRTGLEAYWWWTRDLDDPAARTTPQNGPAGS